MNGMYRDRAQQLGGMSRAGDIAEQYESQYGDPRTAWRKAYMARELDQGSQGVANPQALADAEHYLWGKYFASKGLPQAIVGLGGPLAWSGYKSIRQGLGDIGLMDDPGFASEPTLTQLMMGQRGANQGFLEQLRGLWR